MTRRRYPDRIPFPRSTATVLIAAGILLLGAASALAVSGPSGRGSAAVAQYGGTPETPTTPTTPQTAAPTQPSLTPPSSGGPAPSTPSDRTDRGDRPGASTPDRKAPVGEVARRVESGADGGELPFTGMAIVPVLAAGLLLLLTGAVLRHRAGRLA